MEDPQPPSAQPKKKLLFKRTIRKPAEQPKEDDDGLSLFSRSNEFFPTVIQDRQREAAEKAAKAEKERKAKLERARKAEEEALRDQESFLRRQQEDTDEDKSSSKKKRRRISLSDNENDDVFTTTTTPRKSRKSPSANPKSPQSKRDSTRTPRSTRSLRVTRQREESAAVISLDSSDDDDTNDVKPQGSRSPSAAAKSSAAKRQEQLEDSDLEIFETDGPGEGGDEGENAEFDIYIKGAMERAEKRKREAAARAGLSSNGESKAHDAGDQKEPRREQEPVVQILITSPMEDIQPLVFKRKLHQPLALVRETWVEMQLTKQQQQREEGAEVRPTPRSVLEDMFFTWRGDKVYPSATLETLGIQPPAVDGSLYPTRPHYRHQQQADASTGYFGHKVHFEAWTQPLYEEYLHRRERERLRARGELSDEDEDEDGDGETGGERRGGGNNGDDEGDEEKEEPVRVILKARDTEPEKIRVRSSTTVALLALVFKRQKKLPQHAVVELHWDGEVLDPASTVADADIEDMDVIEVHIK